MNWLRDRDVIWDVTAPRAPATVGHSDLLFEVTGLTVPRVVADPSDPIGDDLLDVDVGGLSELAAAEQYFRHRLRYRQSADPADYDRAVRLANLRQHPDLRVIDLDSDEADNAKVLASPAFRKRLGQTLPLGRGEIAVIAVAVNREYVAGLDDGAARAAAAEWGVQTMTTQDLLRAAIERGVKSPGEAQAINDAILAEGFRGDAQL